MDPDDGIIDELRDIKNVIQKETIPAYISFTGPSHELKDIENRFKSQCSRLRVLQRQLESLVDEADGYELHMRDGSRQNVVMIHLSVTYCPGKRNRHSTLPSYQKRNVIMNPYSQHSSLQSPKEGRSNGSEHCMLERNFYVAHMTSRALESN